MADISKITDLEGTEYNLKDTTARAALVSREEDQNGTDLSMVTTGEKYTWNHAASSGSTVVHISGDETITGNKKMSGDFYLLHDIAKKRLRWQPAAGNANIGSITFDKGDSDTVTYTQFSFWQYRPNDTPNDNVSANNVDIFYLPKTTTSASGISEYSILTSKTINNQEASSGGTTLSLVTTGEKYTWNNKADDSGVVHNTGNENVAGNKTFTSDIRMTVAATNKKLYFKHNEDTNGISANINVNAGNATKQTVNQMSFVEYSPKSTASTDNTGFCERYYLPTPTKGLSGDAEYDIYTSKNLTSATAASGGSTLSLVTTGEKYTWNNKASSDTHRIVQLNGTEKLAASGSTPLNLIPGTNVTITYASGGAFTIAATNTTYESKAAAEGGTAVSLVTTGQKYTWNNKAESDDCLLRTGNQTATGIKTLSGLQIKAAAGSASRYKALWFTQVSGTDGETAINERCAGIYVDAGNATNQTLNRLRFYLYSPSSTASATNTGYSEQYFLPTPEKDLSESKTYDIITTKNLPSASDLGVKAVQTAVSDPSASGTGVTYIATISQNAQGVITATKSTVRTMSAASSSAAGATGLVPQPAKGKQDSYLKGDATWAVPTADLFKVVSYTASWSNLAKSTNLDLTGTNFSISTPSGYTPVGAVSFSSGNATVAVMYVIADNTGSNTVMRIRNVGTSTAGSSAQTASIKILYVKTAAISS